MHLRHPLYLNQCCFVRLINLIKLVPLSLRSEYIGRVAHWGRGYLLLQIIIYLIIFLLIYKNIKTKIIYLLQ